MSGVRVVVWVGEKRKDPRTARNAAEDNHGMSCVKEGRDGGYLRRCWVRMAE